MPGSILVCVNGSSSSRRALAWAAQRTNLSHEAVILTCVVNHAFSSQVYGHDLDPMANAERVLEAARDEIQRLAPAATVEVILSEGPVRRKIIDETWQRSVVVLGTDRSYDLPGPSFGTLPLIVAANSHCPTVVVPDIGEHDRTGIVTGVDNTHLARAVIRAAAREALAAEEVLQVINAWRTPETFAAAETRTGSGQAEPARTFLDSRRRLLDRLVRELPSPLPRIATDIRQGEPAQILVDAARHAELLVIGTRGHHGISAAFLGSVSRDVLLNISSATMVVPPTHVPA